MMEQIESLFTQKIPLGSWVKVFVDYLTDLFSDDLMGSTTIRLDPRVLTPKLTTVGSWMTQKVRLSGGTGDLFGIAGEADYDLYLKVTRLADRPLLNQR